ncbi:helix-turn-helix domain-containing protein [Marinifilum sp. D737]|uniref:helix-turn-helix domain-containing protein n=1 Tax=Marinifilum sp. D737 TaxID=2969628 RepID=UPI0022740ED4|nr:helix-turn-helix domain-containing protein [Marinifilum sp. D737]MCY1633288.1 helix-turn-helix domain-containing protein [Marinifilum sp. D737]
MKDLSSIDDQFLRKIHQNIEANFADEDFSVNELAQNVGLSRSMLHRKLTKTCGKSASELIKEIRLAHAKTMLENNVATVSEIAYQVGFRNPSYFNKVFKSHYKVSPGDIKKGINISSKGQLKLFSRLQPANPNKYVSKFVFPVLILCIIVFAGAYISGLFNSKESSIAVLPLHNLTGSADNNYFVDGMHDALIGKLGQFSSLRVISRTSTLRYRDDQKLLSDIANELEVNCIVEGSVINVDDSIRILIQLIDVFPEERHLLAKEYKDEVKNVFAVQTSVIKDIADEIKLELSDKEKIKLSKTRKVNPETYKAYLQGMHYLNQGTHEAFEKGIQYLHGAIKNDPGDPLAYAGLAIGYGFRGHGELNSKDAFRLALSSANKALKLDPTIDEAYNALALLYLYKAWNWPKAKETFENAIRNNPNNSVIHAHFAWYHVLFGDKKKSIHHGRQATILEPFSAAYASWLGLLYYHNRQYDKAEEWANKALKLKENVPYGLATLGWICIQRKEYQKAIDYFEKLPANNCHWNTILGYAYVKAGQRDKAVALWNKLNKNPNVQNPYHMGIMASYLGFIDKAFELIDEACANKIYPTSYIVFNPCGEYIRRDSRYNDLLRKLNLPNNKTVLSSKN